MPEINNRLKDIRKRLGINQKQMAERVGIRQSYYSDVENGKRNVSKRIMDRLISEFNVSETWIFTGMGDTFSEKSGNKNVSGVNNSDKKDVVVWKELDLIPSYLSLDNKQIAALLGIEFQSIMKLFDTRQQLIEVCEVFKKEDVANLSYEENFRIFQAEWDKWFEELYGTGHENRDGFYKILKLVYQLPAMKEDLISSIKFLVNQIYRSVFKADSNPLNVTSKKEKP